MSLGALIPVLDRTSPGTSARLLRTFPDERRQVVLERINDSELVRLLIAEGEETAGALTTTEFLALRVGMTVDQATTTIRRSPGLTQNFERLFVVDGQERLFGGLSFRDLLLANERAPLSTVMEEVPITVSSDTGQEECARLMERYHLEALPIVDEQRRLLGFVDLTDVLDVAEEEATEDMYQIVGLSGQCREFGLGVVPSQVAVAVGELADGFRRGESGCLVRVDHRASGDPRRFLAYRRRPGRKRHDPDGDDRRSEHRAR